MAKVSLDRTQDGRHAVLDAQGRALGLHNSLRSAQRQLEDYYQPPIAKPGPQVGGPGRRQVAPVRQQLAGQMGPDVGGPVENPMHAQAMMAEQMAAQRQMQEQAHHQMLMQAGVNPMMLAAHKVFEGPNSLDQYGAARDGAQPMQPGGIPPDMAARKQMQNMQMARAGAGQAQPLQGPSNGQLAAGMAYGAAVTSGKAPWPAGVPKPGAPGGR